MHEALLARTLGVVCVKAVRGFLSALGRLLSVAGSRGAEVGKCGALLWLKAGGILHISVLPAISC